MKFKLLIKILFVSGIFLLHIFGINGQIDDMPPNAEPGSCYAKLKKPISFEVDTLILPVYIGDGDENVFLDTMEIVIHEGGYEWSHRDKKGSLCLCYRLREVQEAIIVVDTLVNKNFIHEVFIRRLKIPKSDILEWQEVVCEYDITKGLIEEVESELKKIGYYKDPINGEFTTNLERCLKKFQRENGFYSGGLSIETVEALGIYWY